MNCFTVYLVNEQHSWDKFCHPLIYVFINHLENKLTKAKQTSNITNKY